ncbi:MAG: hypothetical protein LBU85_04795 [Treponema sp.]|jgi:hypothetical protein|nr:hypothetical protein [Treponema sp.]
MKKTLVVSVCFFVLTVSIFGQAIDKAQYKAIDPFDYKLDEDKARRGTERKFKSVVEFVSENKSGNTIFYLFSSLDKHTLLPLDPRPGIKPPSPGQTVTVYYTVNKRATEDLRTLDAFEDNKNKDEKAIGVEKTAILPSSGIRKSDYETITADDYRDDALFTQEGDEDRKYKSTLQFVSQNGILFKFSSPENPAEEPAFLSMKVKRRYSQYTTGQKMVVYFTASKDYKDFLILDDIELMN